MRRLYMSSICNTDCMAYRNGNCPYHNTEGCPRWRQAIDEHRYLIDAMEKIDETANDQYSKVSTSYNDGIISSTMKYCKIDEEFEVTIQWKVNELLLNNYSDDDKKTEIIYLLFMDMINKIKGADC